MNIFKPWRRVSRVDLIDLDELENLGIRCLLLDRDNTCVPRDTGICPDEILGWLENARRRGMKTCIVSNNFHSGEVAQSACEMGCSKIDHAMKPAPFALWKALAEQGVPAEQTCLIGDQLFTDVFAGHLGGIRTILVKPQSTEDLWYTQIFRIFENLIAPDARFEEDNNSL